MSIVVEQIEKSFAGSVVIQNASLSIAAGEMVNIVGANASGKSTLVRLLSGILRPDRGSITIAGVDLGNRPSKAKREITTVYQDTLFNPMINPVKALLTYGSFYQHRLTANKVQNGLLELGVKESDLHKPILMLSGGTKKKVEFVKCLLCDTAVYLFDEPFAGFDVASRKVGYAALDDLRARRKAILLIDHEQGLIDSSDRVLEFRAGRLIPKLTEGVKISVRVQAEVRGWSQGIKAALTELPEITAIAVKVAPMSGDDIALALQKAGITPGGRPIKIIYSDGDQSAIAKLLGMSGATMQTLKSSDGEVASHVILTFTLTAQAAADGDLTWLKDTLSTHQLEVLSLEMMGP